jgi:hypothetical protein
LQWEFNEFAERISQISRRGAIAAIGSGCGQRYSDRILNPFCARPARNHWSFNYHKCDMRDVAFNPNLFQQQPLPVPTNPKPGTDPLAPRMSPDGMQPGVPKGRMEAMGQTQVTGQSVFDDLAGVKPEDHKKAKQKSLDERRQTSVQQRSRNAQRKTMTRLNLNPDEDDSPIREVASDAVSTMRGKGRKGLQEEFDGKGYDPLQQYAVLHNAMCDVQEKSLPPKEKEVLRDQLNQMMSDLMVTHRDQIRQGLKDSHAIDAAMQAMAGGTRDRPASLRELRFLYGAKGKGVFDSPISALAMTKALKEKFGPDNFVSGMASLQSRMSTEFRRDPQKGTTPRLILCMSDANAFVSVATTHKIATELRRDLIDKANVIPRASNVALTESLLSVAEQGKPKLNSLVNQIKDIKDEHPVMQARVQEQVLHAIRKLPSPLWSQEKLVLDVIDELNKQIGGAYQGMPLLETSVERRERQWRATWDEEKGRSPAGDGDANQSQKAAPAA